MKKYLLFILFCVISAQLVLAENMDITIDEGDTLSILERVNITDPEGSELDISFKEPLDNQGVWQTDYDDAGTYYTEITVSDDKYIITQVIKITVNNVNREPVITTIHPDNYELTISELDSIIFSVSAEDPDKDKLYYSWKLDDKELSASPTFKYKTHYYSKGDHKVKLTVSDGDKKTERTWNIRVLNTNAPPQLEDLEDIAVNETDVVRIVPKATDIDGDKVYYTFSRPFDKDGVWKTNYNDSGTYDIEVIADDNKLRTTKIVKVVVKNKDRIPVFIFYSPKEKKLDMKEDERISFEVKAIDPDRDEINFTWKVNNEKAGYERRFKFEPDYDSAGTYNIQVFAFDGTIYVLKEWFVVVKDVNRPPALESFEEIVVEENDTVIITPNASDPDNDTLIIKFSEPADKEGRWKTGFEDEGTYRITVNVSDGELSDSKQVKIIVKNKDRPAEFEKLSPVIVYEGESIKYTPIAYDLDGQEVKITASDLPEGAVFEDNTLEWTPDYETVKRNTNWFGRLLNKIHLYNLFIKDQKKFSVLFTAESGEYKIDQPFSITVKNKNRAPVLSGIRNIRVKELEEVDVNASVYDPDDDFVDLKFSAPLDRDGQWRTSFESAGVYNASVSATDGEDTATEEFKITVKEENRIPIIYFTDKVRTVEGKTVVIDPKVVDLDGDNVTLTYSGWMNSSEQEIGYKDSGVYTVLITASDGEDFAQKEVTVFVRDSEEESALWFYGKFVLLGLLILLLLLALLAFLEHRKATKKERMKKKALKEKEKLREEREKLKELRAKEKLEAKEQKEKEKLDQKLAKKDLKAEKIIPITPKEEESKETNWKKWVGIGIIVLLLLALLFINYQLLKPSDEVKIDSVKPQTIFEGEAIEIPLNIKNADTFSVKELPAGAEVKDMTILWTPTFEQNGTHTMKACAENNISSECIDVVVDVKNKNRAPEISKSHPKTRTMMYSGKPILFVVDAEDPDGDKLKYEWTIGKVFKKKIDADEKVKITFNSLGKKTVTVKVSDKEFSETKTWVVDIVKRPVMDKIISDEVDTYIMDGDIVPSGMGTISYIIWDDPEKHLTEDDIIIVREKDTPEEELYEEKSYTLNGEEEIEIVKESGEGPSYTLSDEIQVEKSNGETSEFVLE